MVVLCGLALTSASADALASPVITGVSPERAPVGWGPAGENDLVREITLTGEDLAEATVTTPEYESGGLSEKEFEVKEDTGTSLVVDARIGTQPGVQPLIVHTPAGTAATQVIYEPQSGVYPVIGRCVPTSGGVYKDRKCSKATATKGKYEWAPGIAGGAVSFSGGMLTFGQVSCSAVSGAGTMANPSEVGDVVLTLQGCTLSGLGSCTSTGTAGEVETMPLLVDLGWNVKGGTSKVKVPVLGLFPSAIGGTLAQFVCGGRATTLYGVAIATLKQGSYAGSMPIPFESKKSKPGLLDIEWVGWGIGIQPDLEVEGGGYGGTARFVGTLTMDAPEPFVLNTTL